MNTLPYLKVGDTVISLADLFNAFFSGEDNMMQSVNRAQLAEAGLLNIKLCIDTRMGTVMANPSLSTPEYPCIELEIQPSGANSETILMARAEVNQTASKPVAPEVFLYPRADSYIAHMPVDTRPADLLDSLPDLKPEVYISGDPGVTVQVIRENEHSAVTDA